MNENDVTQMNQMAAKAVKEQLGDLVYTQAIITAQLQVEQARNADLVRENQELTSKLAQLTKKGPKGE